jgi:hypothetical protein
MKLFLHRRWALLPLLLLGMQEVTAAPPPFADVHTHFNWDQEEVLDAGQVAALLAREGVAFTVASSTPSDFVLKLKAAAGARVIALFSPYVTPDGRRTWYRDKGVLTKARQALASGHYAGLGEVHLMAGRRPRRDNAVFQGLLQLAREFRVPVLIHVDASRPDYLRPICQGYPEVRFLLAHAGGILRPAAIEQLLGDCPNLWVEFSARDPWRYDGLTDEAGHLLPGWRALVERHPTRFMVGTDPVWGVTRTQRWDEPDEGWTHFGQLLDYHRRWLAELPPALEARLRLDNARQFFQR